MARSHKCPHLNSLGAADKAKLRASAPMWSLKLASVRETSGTKVGGTRNNESWTRKLGFGFFDSVIRLQPELHRYKWTFIDRPHILFSLIANCHYEILLKIGRRLVGSVSKCQELQGRISLSNYLDSSKCFWSTNVKLSAAMDFGTKTSKRGNFQIFLQH